MNEDTALAERPQSAIAKTSPEEFAAAFDAYIAMQKIIDSRMPDAIMSIQGKKFRKKAYWRAVAVAFNVDVAVTHDEYFESGVDWGYRVTCCARIGERDAVGDGTCMASEKPGRNQATHHNVRGHAHTRAFNRAVSNLVGFGEVSAEEINDDRGEAPKRGNGSESSRAWDGELVIQSGKNKGTKWKDLPSHFIDWALEQKGTIRDMAAKEAKRRVLADETSQVVDGEVVDDQLPLGEPDPDDPRFR